MNDVTVSADDIAEALLVPGALKHLREIPAAGSPRFWHDVALTLFAAGKHPEMKVALGELSRAFHSRPIVIREPYLYGRIGEMASVLGTLAHLRRRGKLPVLPILLTQSACSPAYLRMWSKHFDLLTSETQLRERYGEAVPDMRVGFLPDCEGRFYHVGEAYALARMMDDKPLLTLSEEEEGRGRDVLHDLGMPRSAWFVCLHARSPVYMRNAGVDDRHNEYRNTDIKTFAMAAHRIAERGGWVVRIGDKGVEPMPTTWPNTIDLPHAHPSADWLDVFSMGGCRFFLGDSSGPIAVAATLGRTCIGVNLQLGSPSSWMALHMPKLYRREGKILTLGESLDAGMFMRQRVPPDGIEVIDNTAEEIEAAVVEYMDGCLVSAERQERYLGCFADDTQRVTGLASPAFLERHEEVLR